MKAVCHQNQKQKHQHQGHHDIEVLIARLITDVTSTFLRRRRNGNTPVGYLGQAALRREKYVTMTESWISLTRRGCHCYAVAW
jgi:hypothetical protein